MTSTEYFWAGLNGLASFAIMFVCVCRLKAITPRVLLRVKVSYLLLLMGAAANGMAPWKFELPGWPSTAFAVAVLLMLLADAFQWLHGPPKAATKRPNEESTHAH